MAINASMQWWIRAGGDQTNGGGYDAAVSGAGTNYCDQDAAQLSLTDLATSGAGSTTLTSATGGFTAAMIGNVIRIASGTNFQTGYYVVTGYTNGNTVALDRTPTSGGAGSGGNGKLGGAFPSLINLGAGGSATAPTLTSPLAAGHTINVRGSGSNDPGTADYTQNGYYAPAAGSLAAGKITLKGYNGRPRFDCNNLLLFDLGWWLISNIMFVCVGTNFATNGFLGNSAGVGIDVEDCLFDVNGYDIAVVNYIHSFKRSTIRNSGSTAAGSYPALDNIAYNSTISGVYCRNFRGWFVTLDNMASITQSVIAGCRHSTNAAIIVTNPDDSYGCSLQNLTIYGGTASGIKLTATRDVARAEIFGCILDSNGAYGIDAPSGTALNDRLKLANSNFYRNNTSGERNNLSAGSRDVTLTADPFTNAAAGDFSLNMTAGGGAAVRAASWPGAFPGSTTTGYMDGGAVQRQERAPSTYRAMLVLSTYTFNPDHDYVSDVVAYEAGGGTRQTLTSRAVTIDDSLDAAVFDFADVTFPTVTTGQTLGGMIVYRFATGDSDSVLCGWYPFTLATDGTDVTVSLPAPASGGGMTVH